MRAVRSDDVITEFVGEMHPVCLLLVQSYSIFRATLQSNSDYSLCSEVSGYNEHPFIT